MRARHGRNKLRPQIFQGGSHLTPNEGASRPTRREFLRKAAGAGLALAGSSLTAWGDHHGHPTPNSITYLDRRMYIHNMELLAHFVPGQHRGGKMQMMSNRHHLHFAAALLMMSVGSGGCQPTSSASRRQNADDVGWQPPLPGATRRRHRHK